MFVNSSPQSALVDQFSLQEFDVAIQTRKKVTSPGVDDTNYTSLYTHKL